MILLNVAHVTKRFGPEPVLDGVTFEVRPGERIGLVGPNGCGKSTLMKILVGREEPDSGIVERHPSSTIGYLEQHPEFPPDQTLWEAALEGMADVVAMQQEMEATAQAMAQAPEGPEHDRLARKFDRLQHELTQRGGYQIDHQVQRVLDGLGFDRESHGQLVNKLSGGQQNRLMLARLLLALPDLMLLDEPSNHLDLESTRWLEDFLASTEKAVIVVSHDRYFLDKVTNRTIELFHGTVDSYPGNFSAYWRQKAERLEVQRRTYEKQQQEIAKTEDFIRRNHYGQKHAQAEDRRKKLERIERVPPPREIHAPPIGFPPASRTGDIVLTIQDLAKSYDRPLFKDLTFTIQRGQRWGILGPNGTGKTTLLRCILGQVQPEAGEIKLGTGVRIGYLDQLTAGLDFEQPVVEAIRPDHKEFNEPQRRDLLARFGITGDAVFQKVGSLSGGERSRAGLARLAARDSNVLILDEPTNHLDIWARDALERGLNKYDGTLLFVSHDRYFLNQVADHLLVVEGDRFRIIDGNYDTYLHFVAQGLAEGQRGETAAVGTAKKGSLGTGKKTAAAADGKPSASAVAEKPGRRKRRFPYRKVADLEADIQQREQQLQELQERLASPDVFREGSRIKEIQAQIAETQQQLEQLYEHWEEAVELN